MTGLLVVLALLVGGFAWWFYTRKVAPTPPEALPMDKRAPIAVVSADAPQAAPALKSPAPDLLPVITPTYARGAIGGFA